MMRFHPGIATATGRPATRAAWRQWPLMKVFEEEEEEEAAEAEVEWLMKKLSSRSLTCSGLSSCNLASEMSPLMAAISASVGWTDGYTHTHTFRYMYKWRPSQIEIQGVVVKFQTQPVLTEANMFRLDDISASYSRNRFYLNLKCRTVTRILRCIVAKGTTTQVGYCAFCQHNAGQYSLEVGKYFWCTTTGEKKVAVMRRKSRQLRKGLLGASQSNFNILSVKHETRQTIPIVQKYGILFNNTLTGLPYFPH